MSYAQMGITAILLGAVVLFIWGRPRYDLVALLALLGTAILGLLPGERIFAGFGHPAVITVVAVLIVSRGLRNAGVVDVIAGWLSPLIDRPQLHLAALTVTCGFCSAFMNNVGALAILMPVALESAAKQNRSPAAMLMPLSFGAILGGLSTMIGTPPNVIIAQYRADAFDAPFRMFDFSPVGGIIALLGVAYLILFGWRLIPRSRQGEGRADEIFQIRDYMTEARLNEGSALVGASIASLPELDDLDVLVTALIRGEERRPAPSRRTKLQIGDVLVLRADPTDLKGFIEAAGLELVGDEELSSEHLASDEVALIEAVITARSNLTGRSARTANLRNRHGLNLLAIARQGQRVRTRLDRVVMRAGDVLLLQGDSGAMPDTLARLGCLPLMRRGLRLGQEPRVLAGLGIFAAALAASGFGLLPAAVALTAAAVAMVLFDFLTLREMYEAIDWPVIVLLGGMIPVGGALESTGTAALLANGLVGLAGSLPVWAVLAFVLILTMTLSDVMNNAATAVVMAPISVGIARGMDVSPDGFLMAVAIGASCAFLTPIGHQCNTLVLGPGGYRFSDYWRVGLPLEVLIVAVSVPLIMWIWI
ncbi:MAG: SLC13 family permease [Rhodospirillaceae bacterium]|nr:SLC13 family permease [Rhodospirillaceae bacterium]MBT3493308.1 SLC13 family permease [Rhodospirillaceae bacterium]MBT3782210.1 SLC13 family permease [Rhodospirillaceae bacterium]MBT3977729.1 SLC13 family permease [Rhodospirillaceae bacterium]MBT4169625.1 SLC13 family permease [Rhodospirillaceae bacterium]